MVINSPFHSGMVKEIQKATNIINAFFDSRVDADSQIPAEMIRNCAGLAFLTVVKAGMIWTGKLGTGVVIARLDDGSWSAPSGIGTAGIGVGAEIGGELVDFMIVLGSPGAVKTFKRGTQVSVGAGLELAIGPVGRAAGASANAGKGGLSGNYTYSHAKGAFAGVGLHGSTIMVRGDMNRKFYGRDVTPMELLSGHVQPPAGSCDTLYDAIRRAMGEEGISVYPSTDPRSPYYTGNSSSSSQSNGLGATAAASSGSFSSRNSFGGTSSTVNRGSFNNSSMGASTRSSLSNLPAPSTAEPDPDDPRLRRYSGYKSERELYAQFARGKSGSTVSTTSGSSNASSGSAPAATPATSSYSSPYTATATATAPRATAPVPPASYTVVPASTYMTAPPPAPAAPRVEAPPIPTQTVGPETKKVYTEVIAFVSARCPHANVQVFKDNCRLFGQDQMSLDAYFAYLTSICTSPLLKELIPQLVRLLPTLDKRERLWAIYVREVLFIR